MAISGTQTHEPTKPSPDVLNLNPDRAVPILHGFIVHEVRKVSMSAVVVNLSGGIDSAVSTVLAAQALGPENVCALMLPYETSHPDSLADAAKRAAEEHHAAQLAAMGSTLLNPSAPAPVATQPAKPAGPPPLPPRPEALRFHYESDGPLSAMDIATKLAADPDERHLVWREGMEGWVNAADVSLIASLMTKLPPALPAKEEVVPEAAVVEAAELAVDEAAEA